MRVFSGETVGVLVHVERADQHRTSGFHLLHQEGIGLSRRVTAVDDRARQGDLANDVVEIFDCVRNTGQSTERV